VLVRDVVDALAAHFSLIEEEITTARETIEFKLPRGLETA
jgi:4-hydroxy-3-methylbut-2-enyl diphosphate reductase